MTTGNQYSFYPPISIIPCQGSWSVQCLLRLALMLLLLTLKLQFSYLAWTALNARKETFNITKNREYPTCVNIHTTQRRKPPNRNGLCCHPKIKTLSWPARRLKPSCCCWVSAAAKFDHWQAAFKTRRTWEAKHSRDMRKGKVKMWNK